jgi:hypothetical protein
VVAGSILLAHKETPSDQCRKGSPVRERGSDSTRSSQISYFGLVAEGPSFEDVSIVRNGLRHVDVVRRGDRARVAELTGSAPEITVDVPE